MTDDNLKIEIEQLKKNMFSGDCELVKSSAVRLGKIGGDSVVDFLISLIALDNSSIRNLAALALEEIKDNRAVEPLINSIFKKENLNYNGTMVFALESLDCSKNFKDIFKILFYQGYEAKMSAYAILDEQEFDFNDNDLLEIQRIWDECLQNPRLCPDFEDSKDDIQDTVNTYLSYLNKQVDKKPSS
jgi:hypothetical protein